jgi:SAM-dependent methyltransferase
MNLKSVEWFRCMECGSPLRAQSASLAQKNGNIAEGELTCNSCGRAFPIVRSIPRFVPSEDYAESFGYQWNYFDKTQLDSHMGNDLSRERFFATTQWPQKMDGQVILEAGCGMGRFTQIALETGAELFSFDLSNAVEANLRNNGDSSRVHILQASIYEIPLCKESFDKVFCMGVLQHCPDVRAAFMSLVPYLRPGGEIVIDVYQKHTGVFPPLKYWARPFLSWMGPKRVHKFLTFAIPPAFALKKALYKVPLFGKPIGKLIPIGPVSHAPRLNFTDEELIQVKILSALDMYSPVHDHPQTIETVRGWFSEAGLVDVYVGTGFNGINARGRKPR